MINVVISLLKEQGFALGVGIRSCVVQTVERTIQKMQIFAADAGRRFLDHVCLVEQHYLMVQNTAPTAEKRSDYVL